MNLVAYILLATFWILSALIPSQFSHLIDLITNIYRAVVFLCAALGFISYGGRLYMMLRQFPIESRGRQSKLTEARWLLSV